MGSVKGGEEEIRQEGRTGGGRELRSMKAEGRWRKGEMPEGQRRKTPLLS